MRIALADADVGHDLARLHTAIFGRPAGSALEEFEQREVEILVQRLARAHDLVAVSERALDPGDRHVDGDRLRIGFFSGQPCAATASMTFVEDLSFSVSSGLIEIGADIRAARHLEASRSA